MSTHNLCFEQKDEKYQGFLSEKIQFFEVKCSIYLNGRVFVITAKWNSYPFDSCRDKDRFDSHTFINSNFMAATLLE